MTDDFEEPPVEGAAALPRSIEPPHDLWPGIAARLAPPAHAARPAARWRRALIAAAAVLALMIGSSALTVWYLRGHARPPGVAAALAPEAGYLRTTAELGRALAARRGRLAPATVVTLERNLAIIDQAIAESRAALARDPGDPDLAALLWATYAQKVALLRQAVDLPLRS